MTPIRGDRSASTVARVRRWTGTRLGRGEVDEVAAEEPLELRVDTRSVGVVMRTPGHDEELAAGFLLSEGLVRRREDIAAIRVNPRNRAGNVVDVVVGEGVRVDFARLSRHVFAGSSCGLCGVSTIAATRRVYPGLRARFRISAEVLAGMPGRMRSAQAAFTETGGMHAAALFGADGELECLREDVGRHNAVDKVLGRAFLEGRVPLSRHVLMVSGRVSFEIVQKALAGGIGMVAAVSAPTSLAVALARRSGLTLVGFLRDGRFNVYSRPGRLGGSGGGDAGGERRGGRRKAPAGAPGEGGAAGD